MNLSVVIALLALVVGLATLVVELLAYAKVSPTVASKRLGRWGRIGTAVAVIATAALVGGRMSVGDREQCGASTSPAAPASTAPPTAETEKAIEISEPEEGQKVGRPIVVEGTAPVLSSTDLWILDLNDQGCFFVKSEEPVEIQSNGKWSLPDVKLGREGGLDKGNTYDIWAILVPREVSSVASLKLRDGR